jgi:hypothetical protein
MKEVQKGPTSGIMSPLLSHSDRTEYAGATVRKLAQDLEPKPGVP